MIERKVTGGSAAAALLLDVIELSYNTSYSEYGIILQTSAVCIREQKTNDVRHGEMNTRSW